MIKYFRDALRITNNNMILATPLILFLILISLYNGMFADTQNANLLMLNVFISLLMWAAFLSGWFYFVNKIISLFYQNISLEEKVKKAFNFINPMLKGVGEFFFSYFSAFIMFFGFLMLLMLVVHYIGMHYIGQLNIPVEDFINVANSNSQEAVEKFVAGIPFDEAVKFLKWSLLSMFAISVFLYTTMFWFAAIIKQSKNPIKALYLSNVFLWKNFLSTFTFFVSISVLQLVVMVICGMMSVNPILSFVSLILYFYFIVYIVVLIFLYYEKA